jgi:hypothetical protein
MSDENTAVMGRANHEAAAAAKLMLQELECIRPLITDIYQLTPSREHSDTLQPKSTFPRRSLSPLRWSFLFRSADAVVEDLVQQANHFTTPGIHSQTVVADITPMITVSNLPKILQRKMRCVIQFRGIVDHENSTVQLIDLLEHALAMGFQHRFVRYIGARAQAIESFQVAGRLELVGKRSAGMTTDAIGAVDQPLGSSFISKYRVAEMHLTETLIGTGLQNHRGASVTRQTSDYSVTRNYLRRSDPRRSVLSLAL